MTIKILPANPDLAEFFLKLRQDPDAQKYNPLVPSTVEDLRARLSRYSSDLANEDHVGPYFWFVGFDNDIAGYVALENVDKMMLTVEIGCAIDKKYRGNGIATAAIRLITENVFRYTKLRKIIGYAHEDNVYSRRMMVNLGYREEGILREHYLVNGKPANQVLYGGLRQDFDFGLKSFTAEEK